MRQPGRYAAHFQRHASNRFRRADSMPTGTRPKWAWLAMLAWLRELEHSIREKGFMAISGENLKNINEIVRE